MIQYHFKCTLLSDVIISSSSATEGFHPSLDYIPGAKFLGIVASKLYDDKNGKETLDLFHNGKVCFGDAHLEIDGERSLKVPLSWFRNKHNPDEGIYVHHEVNDKQLTQNGVQPEQLSGEYFNSTGKYIKSIQSFSIKSAYNSQLRRSEDEKMFGYYALPAGSKWRFMTFSDDDNLLEKVKAVLEGKKHVGRSRSAQYGLAEIKYQEKIKQPDRPVTIGTHYLYADSPIMLPTDLPLGEALPNTKIDFSKSKIRTRIYQSWNTYRHTRDADRQIIEKGSVIAINVEKEVYKKNLLQHLTERSAEGFAAVLIDPLFLTDIKNGYFASIDLSEWTGNKSNTVESYINEGIKDSNLIALLGKRKAVHDEIQNIDLAVHLFVNNVQNRKLFYPVTASQWGTVRSYAKLFPDLSSLNDELFSEGNNGQRKGYLISGIAEEKWRVGRHIIKQIVSNEGNYPNPRNLFLEKLAAEMAKIKHKK